jgi:polyadenylate-binding protein
MNPMMMQPPPMQMSQNTTLYIGNLDKTVTENLIFDRFSRFGKIIRFTIMRDKVRNESRGFAFIDFQNIKDAEAAKNQLNNEKLQAKYIRVMWKGDHKKASPEANVFVKEIDPKISQNDLESYFQRFGPVLSTHLSVNEKGESNGYGFVQFRNPDDARRCVEQFAANSGEIQPLGESIVKVETFKTKGDREQVRAENQRNLYIRDLPESVSDQDIRKAFAPFQIENLIVNPFQAAASKYALVCFRTREDAEGALNKFANATNVFPNQTKPLFVVWHKNRQQLKEERRKARDVDRDLVVYLKNLEPEKTKADIEKVLKSIGVTFEWITSKPFEATESKDSNVRYKTQYAFIKLTSKEHVQTVLAKKDEAEVKELFIKGKPFIDIAMPKPDRERMKQIQQRQRFQFHPTPFPQYLMGPPMQARMPQGPMFQHQMPWAGPQQQRFNAPGGGFQRGGMRGGRPMGGQRGPGGGRGGPPMPRGAGMHPQGGYPRHGGQPQQQAEPRQQAPREAPRAAPAPEAPKKLDLATIRKNWDNFKNLKADDKRNVLGELLYPRVEKEIGRSLAPKITGMLVDFEVMTEEEIVEAIEDEAILKQRITEAKEALDEAEQQ